MHVVTFNGIVSFSCFFNLDNSLIDCFKENKNNCIFVLLLSVLLAFGSLAISMFFLLQFIFGYVINCLSWVIIERKIEIKNTLRNNQSNLLYSFDLFQFLLAASKAASQKHLMKSIIEICMKLSIFVNLSLKVIAFVFTMRCIKVAKDVNPNSVVLVSLLLTLNIFHTLLQCSNFNM